MSKLEEERVDRVVSQLFSASLPRDVHELGPWNAAREYVKRKPELADHLAVTELRDITPLSNPDQAFCVRSTDESDEAQMAYWRSVLGPLLNKNA